MRRFQVAMLPGLLMVADLGGCAKVSVCFDQPDACPLYVRLVDGRLTQRTGGELFVTIEERAYLAPLVGWLKQAGNSASSMIEVPSEPDPGGTYHLSISPQDVEKFSIGTLMLQLYEGSRSGSTPVPISFDTREVFGSMPEISGMLPSLIERLGFVMGGKLMSFRSYKQGSIKQSFFQYTISGAMITQDTTSGYVLSKELPDDPATGDFAQDRAVWLDIDPGKGLALFNCPLMAAGFSDCSNPDSAGYPNNRVPQDIKAFAISPDAKYAVIAEVDGKLRFASLPTQTMTPPALMWNMVVGQPAAMKKERVLAAWGDVTGDGVLDLVAVHQDAMGQEVTVYRGSVSGTLQLSYDPGLSQTWGSAMGAMPIDAMALGDVDVDGRADLGVGRGTQASVWLNGATGAVALAWSAMVPVSGDHKIRALAIGQVDGSGHKDLVVASSTTPDGTGMASQFIHAYLGQPL